ncbi:MAG TPA: TIGR03986 family CRISPR-associated RAMP protein [Chloroflexi bacterium]|nr:TIGR03986 family CRISPR-associated RAMP protein [Chloroflexota bacterium]
MAEKGTIKFVNLERQFGFIRSESGEDVHFRLQVVRDPYQPENLKKGTLVTFEAQQAAPGSRGPTARWVTIGTPARADNTETTGELRPQVTAATQTYRFLNPYNFVRPLFVYNPNAGTALGDCPPPPHDRYVGLTGKMSCRLTATTPLFVSDSHGVTREAVDKGRQHLRYRFFRTPDDEAIAIPGTSLRGALRSTFEAVTNSCFAHFAGGKRLSYHLPPGEALKLVPARVRQNGTQWQLELLNGMTPLAPGQRPSGAQYAAWVHTYDPLWASRTVALAPRSGYARRPKLSLSGWQHGDECQALVEHVKHPAKHFEFWNVVALAKPGATLPRPTAQQRLISGYLCITNQNIENKHDERLFFHHGGAPTVVDLPKPVRDRYRELIQDYQERHTDDVKRLKSPDRPHGKTPAFSRFVILQESRNLENGDLVYARLARGGRGLTVEYIVPVSVPRLGYDQTIGDMLHPRDLQKCSDYDHLCPACRTFGWVWGGESEEKKQVPPLDKPTAYAGRVRISHACRITENGSFDATLAILSTPKPTTTRFYLAPKQGKPRDGLDDAAVGYNNRGQQLRGRKVYRHHGARLNPQEYESVRQGPDGKPKKSDQNRTVHEVQNAGTEFEFTVHFENLAPPELGALLWTLEFEGWNHRLGFGKPLGFGSATIRVTALELCNAATRYSSLTDERQNALDHKADWVDEFKQAMAERYGSPFDQLDNVQDLRALLAESPDLSVHYPRPTRQPHPDGKNYEWFVGNKRSGRDAGPRYVLRVAVDDDEGIPLLDRFGKEVRS